jgi:hypothetical protein
MSGAVQAVKSVAQTGYDISVAPVRGAIDTVQSLGRGEGLGKALGKGVKANVAPYVDLGKGIVGGAMGEPETPNIADPIDPAKVDAENKKERARVKRQAEIDILTDRPGRGGTILTDNYQYKV